MKGKRGRIGRFFLVSVNLSIVLEFGLKICGSFDVFICYIGFRVRMFEIFFF